MDTQRDNTGVDTRLIQKTFNRNACLRLTGHERNALIARFKQEMAAEEKATEPLPG